jgi:tetraacyldisaccharide 4'-kinase
VIKRFNPTAEIIECAHQPQYLHYIADGTRRPLSELKGRRISAFSGIAAPESFEAFLRETGAVLVHTQRFLDHHRFSADDLAEVFADARKSGAELVVTTEKDAVRIPAGTTFPLPCCYLRLEIEILRGADDFDDAVAKICFPRGRPANEVPETGVVAG